MFLSSSLIFRRIAMLFAKFPQPEKKCRAEEDIPVTCTRICRPSMSVLDEWKAAMDRSPRSQFSQCQMRVSRAFGSIHAKDAGDTRLTAW